MNELTVKERYELAIYREAIDLIFDNGKWERREEGMVWVIDEEVADKVQAMVGDLDADVRSL